MTTPPRTDLPDRRLSDDYQRTWLAAEQNWLAWVRTGLTAAAVAIGVGGALPHLSTGADWAYRLLGVGYGALAAAIFVVGAVRQRSVAEAIHHGDPHSPIGSFVVWLTVAAITLMTATLTLLALGI